MLSSATRHRVYLPPAITPSHLQHLVVVAAASWSRLPTIATRLGRRPSSQSRPIGLADTGSSVQRPVPSRLATPPVNHPARPPSTSPALPLPPDLTVRCFCPACASSPGRRLQGSLSVCLLVLCLYLSSPSSSGPQPTIMTRTTVSSMPATDAYKALSAWLVCWLPGPGAAAPSHRDLQLALLVPG